jgi:hypothetical protein
LKKSKEGGKQREETNAEDGVKLSQEQQYEGVKENEITKCKAEKKITQIRKGLKTITIIYQETRKEFPENLQYQRHFMVINFTRSVRYERTVICRG